MVATRFLLIVVVAASASEKELPSPSIVSHQKQAKNKIFNYEWKLLKRRNQRHLSERRQQYPETQHEHADRRVMPWVSMMVLLIFLSLFRSFAAPFFDPLVSKICTIFLFLFNREMYDV